MQIRRIDIYRYNIRMEPFAIATGTMYQAENVLIRITTGEGLTGWGECSPFPFIVGETQDTCVAMARYFARHWLGGDPLDIPARLAELHALAAQNPTAKSAFDMALHDLAARHAGLPLYAFLGGAPRPVETDITIGISAPADMAEQARRYVAQGATMIKIKLGKDARTDVERVARIREAVGPQVQLRLDANQGWSFEEAQQALNSLAGLNIAFCEQPMRTWYDDMLPALAAASPIALMADESCYHFHDARRLIASQSCQYLNIKFAKSGGLAEARKIHDHAASHGMPCMLGSMLESRLALTANLHFACAHDNIRFFDLDTCIMGQLEDPVIGGVKYRGFHLELPEGPGLGATVDEAFLNECKHYIVE